MTCCAWELQFSRSQSSSSGNLSHPAASLWTMRKSEQITNSPSISRLTSAIRAAWSAETSASPSWTPEQPSLGQCAVSALVVQDFLGGELIRASLEAEGQTSHYWNRLPDGREIDLTRDQFPEFQPGKIESRRRDYVLSFPETRRRYELLKQEVGAALVSDTQGVG